MFCRNDTLTQEYIGPHEFKGYGHEFEKAYTKSQISGSTGHHRMISYRFSGMAFIVRYETDGYFNPGAGLTFVDDVSTASDDILSSKLGSLFISTTSDTSDATPAGSKLTVKRDGCEIPLSAIVEIKTRALHRVLGFEDVAPQLWISQTPKLVRAYHRQGRFEVPKLEDVSDKIQSWESEHKDHLQSLAALIRKIVGFAKQCGGNAVVAYDAISDTLVVRKMKEAKLLPEDLYRHWSIPPDQVEGRVESTLLEQTHVEVSTGHSPLLHNHSHQSDCSCRRPKTKRLWP
jgi:hypothetical protein